MKTITVFTASRAEYGLLSPIVKALKKYPEFDVKLVVTGAHLSPEFGLTYKEIEKDRIEIDRKIEALLSADTPSAISKSMGVVMISFADYFAETKPDALMVLGDRYETLAACCVAMNERIPIIHLYGGEISEGAVDDGIRHAITKLSYLHLASTEEYRRRIIQLGETPNRVFTVGAVGIENIHELTLLSKGELEKQIGIDFQKPYAVVTFHPVTLEENSAAEQCEELLKAMEQNSDMQYIVTKANADADGRVINEMFLDFENTHGYAKVFDSLGALRYLSAVKHAEMVIGNSSSGLLEVPSFGIPTINIGDRQKGRIKATSVIDCAPDVTQICEAIKYAKSQNFREIARKTINPYGDGKTTEKICNILKIELSRQIDLKKHFYDIKYND